MILHIFVYDKFVKDFADRINKLFDPTQHLFYIIGDKIHDGVPDVTGENVIFESRALSKWEKIHNLTYNMCRAKRIVFHSLFFSDTYLFLFDLLSLFFKKKYMWFIWGGDLYDYFNDCSSKKKKNGLKTFFIKRLTKVICGTIGDYRFLKCHYVTKAKMYTGMYSYNLPDYKIKGQNKSKLNIMLGNSATATCQYEDALERLKKVDNNKFNVYCILSYPNDKKYVDKIKSVGFSLFGDRFFPVTEFMSDKEYTDFLSEIDIAVFNHNRQQAIGNIMKLLFLGKKVMLNEKNTALEFFESIGCTILNIEQLSDDELCSMDIAEAVNNQNAIRKFYSDANFYEKWNSIFYD